MEKSLGWCGGQPAPEKHVYHVCRRNDHRGSLPIKYVESPRPIRKNILVLDKCFSHNFDMFYYITWFMLLLLTHKKFLPDQDMKYFVQYSLLCRRHWKNCAHFLIKVLKNIALAVSINLMETSLFLRYIDRYFCFLKE